MRHFADGCTRRRICHPRRRVQSDNSALMISMRILLAVAVASLLAPRAEPQSPRAYQEGDFLTRIRRLTVEGRRAGEGYWAPDGRRLVFQSEREPGNPFYQIYTLDLQTGDSKRIST